MKQEDKDLLLKDLCCRLPYGVKVSYNGNKDYEIGGYHPGSGLAVIKNTKTNSIVTTNIENIVPYLFPLSSMTEEQKENLDKAIQEDAKETIEAIRNNDKMFHAPWRAIDWLNANNFDYRGLIPKGLAKDATGLNIY